MTAPSGEDMRYAVNDRDEIVFVNDAWCAFAAANGGERLGPDAVLGRSLWQFIADPTTQRLYHKVLERVRVGHDVRFNFRCDSPDRRRLLAMEVVQVPGGVIEFRTRMLSEEARAWQPLFDPASAHSNEFVYVCAWCKRVDVGGEWVEVEEAVARLELFDRPVLPQLSHGICRSCYAEMIGQLGGQGEKQGQALPPHGAR